jgi:hypothetical protein
VLSFESEHPPPCKEGENGEASEAENNTKSNFATLAELWTGASLGICIVAGHALWFLGIVSARFQRCVEWVGSVVKHMHRGECKHRCIEVKCDFSFRPISANVEETIVFVWTTNYGTVKDISFLRRVSIDSADVVATACQGGVGILRRVGICTDNVRCYEGVSSNDQTTLNPRAPCIGLLPIT